MFTKILKHYLYINRYGGVAAILSSLLFLILFDYGNISQVVLLGTVIGASMYIAQTSHGHNIMVTLPVKRNILLLADYAAYYINIIVVTTLSFALIYPFKAFAKTGSTLQIDVSSFVMVLVSILGALLAKSSYDYLRKFSQTGYLITVIGAIIIFTFSTIQSIVGDRLSLNFNYIYSSIIILAIIIIYYVTNKLFSRFDF